MSEDELLVILESNVTQREKRKAIRDRMDSLGSKEKKELAYLNSSLVLSYELEFGQ